ncbi:MAG: hypothetical protein WC356_06390 [Candidatus Micrarchaeia archaeon]|jgi:hypothetical protein
MDRIERRSIKKAKKLALRVNGGKVVLFRGRALRKIISAKVLLEQEVARLGKADTSSNLTDIQIELGELKKAEDSLFKKKSSDMVEDKNMGLLWYGVDRKKVEIIINKIIDGNVSYSLDEAKSVFISVLSIEWRLVCEKYIKEVKEESTELTVTQLELVLKAKEKLIKLYPSLEGQKIIKTEKEAHSLGFLVHFPTILFGLKKEHLRKKHLNTCISDDALYCEILNIKDRIVNTYFE